MRASLTHAHAHVGNVVGHYFFATLTPIQTCARMHAHLCTRSHVGNTITHWPTCDQPTPVAVARRVGRAALAACLVAPPGIALHTLLC